MPDHSPSEGELRASDVCTSMVTRSPRKPSEVSIWAMWKNAERPEGETADGPGRWAVLRVVSQLASPGDQKSSPSTRTTIGGRSGFRATHHSISWFTQGDFRASGEATTIIQPELVIASTMVFQRSGAGLIAVLSR